MRALQQGKVIYTCNICTRIYSLRMHFEEFLLSLIHLYGGRLFCRLSGHLKLKFIEHSFTSSVNCKFNYHKWSNNECLYIYPTKWDNL